MEMQRVKGQARSKEGEIHDDETGDANLYSNLAFYAEGLESKIKKQRVAEAKAEVRQGDVKKEWTKPFWIIVFPLDVCRHKIDVAFTFQLESHSLPIRDKFQW
ncbi:hypothetical protein ACJX0J_025097, partial [Zea mays]